MKYWAICTAAAWIIALGAFLVARFASHSDEPIAEILLMLVFGGGAAVSTVALLVVLLLKALKI